MKRVKLFEAFVNEGTVNKGKIHKAAKQASYPVAVVVIDGKKVVYQESVNTPEAVPASVSVLKDKYPNCKIHVESNDGAVVFVQESVEINEASLKVAKNQKQAIMDFAKRNEGKTVLLRTFEKMYGTVETNETMGILTSKKELNREDAILGYFSIDYMTFDFDEWLSGIDGKKVTVIDASRTMIHIVEKYGDEYQIFVI
jgi:dipeptidyl aminopeptidase/acylaminoacyl peptidase